MAEREMKCRVKIFIKYCVKIFIKLYEIFIKLISSGIDMSDTGSVLFVIGMITKICSHAQGSPQNCNWMQPVNENGFWLALGLVFIFTIYNGIISSYGLHKKIKEPIPAYTYHFFRLWCIKYSRKQTTRQSKKQMRPKSHQSNKTAGGIFSWVWLQVV